jgi:hypothetical protein
MVDVLKNLVFIFFILTSVLTLWENFYLFVIAVFVLIVFYFFVDFRKIVLVLIS